jgi:hypothetical protein
MEYEKTEVNSGFFYKTAEDREKLVAAERKFIEDRVAKVIEFKRKVCAGDDKKSFVIINQKGNTITQIIYISDAFFGHPFTLQVESGLSTKMLEKYRVSHSTFCCIYLQMTLL